MLERDGLAQELQRSVWRTVLNLQGRTDSSISLSYSLLLVRNVLKIRAVRNLVADRGELIVWHGAGHLLVTGGPGPHDGRAGASGASLQSVMSKDLTVFSNNILE